MDGEISILRIEVSHGNPTSLQGRDEEPSDLKKSRFRSPIGRHSKSRGPQYATWISQCADVEVADAESTSISILAM